MPKNNHLFNKEELGTIALLRTSLHRLSTASKRDAQMELQRRNLALAVGALARVAAAAGRRGGHGEEGGRLGDKDGSCGGRLVGVVMVWRRPRQLK